MCVCVCVGGVAIRVACSVCGCVCVWGGNLWLLFSEPLDTEGFGYNYSLI